MARLKAIFWDIDGTLIRSGGAGEKAWLRAMRSLYGVDATLHDFSWAGRTDPYISMLFFEKFDLPTDPEAIDAFLAKYVEYLPEELSQNNGEVLPGVRELLEHVREHAEVEQGLLTGNVREGAEHKLRHYGIGDYFSVGGYADGLYDRPAIARQAFEAGRRAWDPTLTGAEVLVIGDTPFDIQCGRSIGARTVGVGTGYCQVEALVAAEPDHYFPDLSEVGHFLEEIGLA